ncbi:hypothetical protein F0562_024359 [Nyssa sinensis]|uniref:Uncharacterized protein n=1 Tax=Nyssa sinensis TaxID=561372 RepID=A0A5J5BFV5_9ASTE|nr:hypothetical protein F0562_024359 [Nyssa sinensis]
MVRYVETWPFQYKEGAKTRIINKFSSPPTTDIDTKVPSKPTNHSKYTSRCTRPRCGGCHLHMVCRSKDKTKGTHKLNSRDVVLSHQLVSWRAGDKGGRLNFAGISASWVLDHLSSECLNYEEEDQSDDMVESSCVEEEIELDQETLLELDLMIVMMILVFVMRGLYGIRSLLCFALR